MAAGRCFVFLSAKTEPGKVGGLATLGRGFAGWAVLRGLSLAVAGRAFALWIERLPRAALKPYFDTINPLEPISYVDYPSHHPFGCAHERLRFTKLRICALEAGSGEAEAGER
jgi:hypothetical protein